MPRDLAALADESSLEGMPALTTAAKMNQPAPAEKGEDKYGDMLDEISDEESSKRNELHPYVQTLTLSDIDSCVQLENATFPPNERASPEKFLYRLKQCGELSMGIFTSQTASTLPTANSSAPVYSGAPDRKSVLLGHVVSTKTTNSTVADSDMAIPDPANPDPRLGHKEHGRTLCIHSVAILPNFQGCGLGATLMRAYLQRVADHKVADRVALIAHDQLVPFYERFGFVNNGKSAAQFAGGGWIDMVLEISS